MDNYSTEVGRLQQALIEQRARLDDLDSDSPEHHEQVGEVLIAAGTMLDYERQIPVLRDTARHRISSRIVYTTAGVATAAAAGLGVLAAIGEVSRWYLAPVLLALTLTITLLGTEPGADRGGHDVRVVSAVIALLAVALLALVELQAISANWLWGGLGLVIIAVITRGGATELDPVAPSLRP